MSTDTSVTLCSELALVLISTQVEVIFLQCGAGLGLKLRIMCAVVTTEALNQHADNTVRRFSTFMQWRNDQFLKEKLDITKPDDRNYLVHNDSIIRNYNANHFLAPLRDVTAAAEEGTNNEISSTSLVKHIPLYRTSRDRLKQAKPFHYADDSELERICSWPETYIRERQIADLSWHDEVEYAMTAGDFFDRAPSTNSCLMSAGQKKSSGSLNDGNGKKLDTFTCFPRLTAELRLQIWRTMAFMPHVVALQEEFVLDSTNEEKVYLRTINAVASVLQINHESRTEALNYYKHSFGSQKYFHTIQGTYNKTNPAIDELLIYANLRADTIYYDRRYIMRSSRTGGICSFMSAAGTMRDIFKPAHSVAFDVTDTNSWERFAFIYDLISECDAIEEVLFVVRINRGPTECTSYKHWGLMELNKDETRVCYERYLGEFIELCDAADIRYQKLHCDEGTSKAKIGRLGGPRVRIVGLTRNGVRI
ncbi:hypothetical protein BOTNAR_0064g00030 [Botryotinia narcissicola]|uniref:2EXR domain-containing protein n=1 Tax=Botryotinia narcissicola TaxID=278944 RepID=A0A4Z1IY43_9HELO|nr:hypothetical protein BOTNAR_0064g00030 [Botryotinia narcissicola]